MQDTTHIFRTLGNTERVYKNKCAKEARASRLFQKRLSLAFEIEQTGLQVTSGHIRQIC